MHSCPKKTSEAMFDWMATTALKTLINTIISTFTDIQEFTLGCLFLSILMLQIGNYVIIINMVACKKWWIINWIGVVYNKLCKHKKE